MPALSAPIWRLTIGDHQVARLHQFEVVSSRLAPVSTVTIRLPVAALPVPARGDRIELYQGERSAGIWPIFEGTARRVELQGDEMIVHGWDPMAPVATTEISRSFTGATPQEILRWALSQAGATRFRLSSKRYRSLPRFVADGTIRRVVDALGQALGVRNDLYWLNDAGVWWGPPDESPRALEMAQAVTYGENLLSHTVEAGGMRGRLVAEPLPIYHSNMILVADPRVWSGQRRLRVDRVIYQARPARVVIEWSSPEVI